jgi:penicillin-binding protein 1A
MEYEGRREQPSAPREPRRRTPRKRVHHVGFVIGTILLIGVVTGLIIAGIFMVYVKTTLAPNLKVNADEYTMDLSSILYYQDKETGNWEELQTLHAEENRIWVDYEQIPDALWQAAVSIEDKRFFDHHGVDWSRTASATFNMFLHSRNTYGGSTITQQLLKNMTGDNQGTVKRKVTEIFRALEFEKNYSKQEILELYLNTIYLGYGCYGVQTAAQYYFGKDVSQLSVAECASLIGITNNPSMYGPLISEKTRANNKERQENILSEMLKQGYIDQATYDTADAEELQFTDGSTTAEELVAEANGETANTESKYNSYFVDQVIRDAVNDMQEQLGISEESAKNKIYYGGYNIYTTIDPDAQSIAESVYENRENLDVTSKSGQKLQSGITIVDVTTGNVVAMVGGVGEKTGDLVWNYATGTRQCGSSIKPLSVYAPALDAGAITMASTFDNYPVRELNGNPWPKNSPQGYTGWTTLSTGVARSINTVAVRVIEKLGISNSYQFMTENLNMDTIVADDMNTASLGLGGLTNGTNTEEMAAAYASFANDGVYNSPRLYTKITDAEGNTVLENETDTHVAMKETTAYFMNKLLQGVVSGGTGTSANFGNMAIAGKTGTTSENYDRYFVGYTPYYCAAVWCGYDQNEKISYSGNPSITMWKKVMSQLHDGLERKSFDKPSSGLTSVTVCMDSGLLATDACACDLRGSRVQTVEVATGTAPTESCNLHTMIDYCSEGKCIAGPECPAELVQKVSVLDYTRADYGPSIVADDNPYLLSVLQLIPECPVHAGSGVPTVPEDGEDGTTSTPSEGETGDEPSTTPSEGGETEPTPPEEDLSGYGGGNWWDNVWGTGGTGDSGT